MSEIATLTTILCKLASLAQHETQLHQRVRQDVEKVTRELECMRAFLSNGASENNQQHQVWVRQVRNAAFDSEDILDEYMFHFTPDHQSGWCSCFNFKARHAIASKIKSIIALFQEVSKSNERYRIFRSNTSAQDSHLDPSARSHNRQEDAYFLNDADLVGIEKPKEKLIDLLVTGSSALKVVSIVGMGGMGKTTLVKRVFDDVEVKKRFECHAWIIVTQTYVLQDLLRDLIYKLQMQRLKPVEDEVDRLERFALKKKIDKSLQSMTALQLKEQVRELLQEKSYLIIIDHLWRTDAWDALMHAFPETNSQSRLMITTRIADVASHATTSKDHIYNLEGLSKTDSWTLFCRKAFASGDCPLHLLAVSQRILKKCDGLPLAIATISGLLRDKDSLSEWEAIDTNIGHESIDNILQLSYDDLPDDLRPCYLYFSIFPENYLIKQNVLIRMWIAEGFIPYADGGKTLEKVADSYLKELSNRSMIQVTETTADKRLKACRIHDLLRVMIKAKSKDQNFTSVAITRGTNLENPRRISVHNSLSNMPQQQDFRRVRSLLLFEMEEPLTRKSMPGLFGGDFKLLTVLDLEGAKLDTFPTTIAKLFNLRYLSMRKTEVRNIHSSIGKLQKLETLDLKHTHVSSLPTEIQMLQRLRHLIVYNYYGGHGFKAPEGIGKLRSQQGICDVDAEQGNDDLLRGLGMLTQLLRLGIDGVNGNNQEAVLYSIKNMRNLQSLMLKTSRNETMALQSWRTAQASLQRLTLVGQLESIPHYMVQSLKNLVKIELIKSQLLNDPLEALEQLTNLVHITMDNAYQGEVLRFRSSMFGKLKILRLYNFDKLKTVCIENTAMPELYELSIRRCVLLKSIPSGMRHPRPPQTEHIVHMMRPIL